MPNIASEMGQPPVPPPTGQGNPGPPPTGQAAPVDGPPDNSGMEEEGAPPETDPAFMEAFNFARKALYEGGAADSVNEVIKNMPDPVPHISSLAYDLTAKADEETNGNVKDENLIPLGMYILAEVAEIAEATGAKLEASDVASAFKEMFLRYMGENGMDTAELSQAMNKVKPKDFTDFNEKYIKARDAEVEKQEKSA